MERIEIITALNSDDSSDKLNVLSHLCDIFESYSEEYGDLSEIIQLLVDCSVSERDLSLKGEYINTLQTAAGNKDISSIDFGKLIAVFSSLDHRMMLDVIDIIGFSHNPKCVDFLKCQTASEDSTVASTAAMALEEMTAFFNKKNEK